MPVVSAQAQGSQQGESLVYNLLDNGQLTDEVIQQARAVVGWDVADYSQEHWCRAVLKGYRGFEWDGQPIDATVQALIAFKRRYAKATEADCDAYRQTRKAVWNAAARYWQQQQKMATPTLMGDL